MEHQVKQKKVFFDDITICETNISASDKARNLGIIFDKELSMDSQINNVVRNGYLNIKNLSSIRNTLDIDTAKMAGHAYVTSTLDYENSLLYCIPQNKIKRLQIV